MITWWIYQWLPKEFTNDYPRVNVYIAMENPPIFNGYVITISTGPFSIAMLNNQYTLW